jgi:hypothetical protein
MRIKLECECGQRFAFEVEPVNSRMPAPVECPACGADRTPAANAVITGSADPSIPAVRAREAEVQISIAPHPPAPVKVAISAPPGHQRASRPVPGQTGRAQAKAEARAKISWGDPPNKVLVYLRSQGYGKEESSALLQELINERIATVRGKGITKIISGSSLICVFLVVFFIFRSGGVTSPMFLGLTCVLGLYGIWLFANGLLMLMAPKTLPGDVEE